MVYDIATAKDFLAFFMDGSDFRPRHVFDAIDTYGLVFRGQADSTLPLLPTAHRPNSQLRRFSPQAPGDFALFADRPRTYLQLHLHAEFRAVQLFLQQADSLGLPTPLDYTTFPAHQVAVDAAINGDTSPPFPDPSYVPAFALAQHHGIPTRFLDWTESALVAAFFACYGASTALNPTSTPSSSHIGVFVLDPFRAKRRGVAVARAPRHANDHLRAQHGVFSHLETANAFFLERRKWPALEDVLGDWSGGHDALDLVRLPVSEADETLRLLFRYQITKHHLMPTLTNAANSIPYIEALFPMRQLRTQTSAATPSTATNPEPD